MLVTPLAFWSATAAAQTTMFWSSVMMWQSAFASAWARPRPELRLVACNPALERTAHRATLSVVS